MIWKYLEELSIVRWFIGLLFINVGTDNVIIELFYIVSHKNKSIKGKSILICVYILISIYVVVKSEIT